MMENTYRVEITKSAINHPLNWRETDTRFLTKKEFLRIKMKAKKDKKNRYSFTILSGQDEPLLITEKIKVQFKKIKKVFIIRKTISQMQNENIKREYIQKKYFWIILIITVIISALIGKYLG